MLSGLDKLSGVAPGFSRCSNPGLELANAFGVFEHQLRCAVTVRRVFVRNYKSRLLLTLCLNYRLAHVVAVIELRLNSLSRRIVFEHKQASVFAERACAGHGQVACRKSVLARCRVELE